LPKVLTIHAHSAAENRASYISRILHTYFMAIARIFGATDHHAATTITVVGFVTAQQSVHLVDSPLRP
jgi:hypothetical protein